MSEDRKKIIRETVVNLKQLDTESLIAISGGVQMLKMKQDLDKALKNKDG